MTLIGSGSPCLTPAGPDLLAGKGRVRTSARRACFSGVRSPFGGRSRRGGRADRSSPATTAIYYVAGFVAD